MGVTIYPVMSVSTTLTRRRKDMARKNMTQHANGSGLGEHRKPRVPAMHWMLLVGAIAGVLALGATLSKGQQYEPYNQGTGLIVAQAEVCFSPDLSTESITLLGTWQRAVDNLEAYERGGPAVEEELAITGQLLYDNRMCATVGEFYHIVIVRHTEGYVLVNFDERYDFDTGTFIVARKDIIPDRGL
jgi:hypothetical protein